MRSRGVAGMTFIADYSIVIYAGANRQRGWNFHVCVDTDKIIIMQHRNPIPPSRRICAASGNLALAGTGMVAS